MKQIGLVLKGLVWSSPGLLAFFGRTGIGTGPRKLQNSKTEDQAKLVVTSPVPNTLKCSQDRQTLDIACKNKL